MPSRQIRPPPSELLELHVFYVPEEVWNFKLNTVPVDITSKFFSAGFIRVSPHMTLRTLREHLHEHLGEDAVVNKYTFLKCIGKKLALVKAKQEMELTLRSFAPPYAFHPELYLLPGIQSFYSSSLSTPERPPSNAECELANAFNHKPPSLAVPDQELDQNPAVLETSLKNHFSQTQEKGIGDRICLWEWHATALVDFPPQSTCLLERKPRRQPPAKHDSSRESEKYKVTVPHVNQNSDQEETEINLTQHREKDANTENGDNAKGRRTTGDSGIPESLEDRDLEYLHSKKSQQHPDITETAADMHDNQSDKNNINNFTHPSQYLSPPTPPLLALCINRPQIPNRVFSTEGNELSRQLQYIKAERKHLEKTREELGKKVKSLLEQNKRRRYHARNLWKKKYFETKKVTASLEEDLNKLRENLELRYQKVLVKLQARHVRKRGNDLTKEEGGVLSVLGPLSWGREVLSTHLTHSLPVE
ncbi:spermatogenesis-associated protein 1 [Sphaerodactylus townsendi]|uniref:spermatogenesis-associated protein 1 n=1 Tax=Sphaerodactylus townsendi TaxID=933632 RepID=UPI0020271D68|nr:spermatogenesis-associated protein 1 [Sphaerodactylus townsendi]